MDCLSMVVGGLIVLVFLALLSSSSKYSVGFTDEEMKTFLVKRGSLPFTPPRESFEKEFKKFIMELAEKKS